jgi:SulP family sulfate permease
VGPSALNRAPLWRDLLAGLTVGLVLIPQALAYAGVAGMPPVAGLYAAALPLVAAALLASSPYLQTGPVALTSLLTFGALAGHAPVGSAEYWQLGMLLALIVGVARTAVGLLRGGVIAHLMSEPMLMGFVPAGAVLIIASQIPPALGVRGEGGSVITAAADALADPATWSTPALAFAAGSLALVLAGRRAHRLFPGVLIALLAGIAVAVATGYSGPEVGPIPAGLPPISLDLPYGSLPELLVPGIVIAIVGFAEPASIARTFATRERIPWDADREFLGQGVANLVAGVSGGYPVGGSLSRTSLNHMAGAVTRLSGAVTGIVVLAFLPAASLLASLPAAVLAGIVISTVLGLVQVPRIVALWRVSRWQFGVAASTFVLTLALAPHIERAVIAGIALSVVVHLARELSLRLETAERNGVLVVRPAGVLWFATAADLHESLIALLEAHPGADRVRLELDGLGRIDLTGLMTLGALLEDVREGGTAIEVTGVPSHAAGLLDRYSRRRSALG